MRAPGNRIATESAADCWDLCVVTYGCRASTWFIMDASSWRQNDCALFDNVLCTSPEVQGRPCLNYDLDVGPGFVFSATTCTTDASAMRAISDVEAAKGKHAPAEEATGKHNYLNGYLMISDLIIVS